MKRRQYPFLNFLSLSLIMHVMFAFLAVALIPKSEKITTIILQTGAISVRAIGTAGSVQPQDQAMPERVVRKFSKIQKVESLPVAKAAEATSQGQGKTGPVGTGSGNGSVSAGSGSGGGQETPLSRYVQKVVTLIENHKNYPSRARALGQQGTVSLKIKLDHAGKLLGMDILDAPPYKILVNAAKDTISSIGNFPSMPEDVTLETLTMNVPIRYELVE
jgi:protein TonB